MKVVIARPAGAARDRLRQAVLGLGLECKSSDCVSYEELPIRLSTGSVDLVLVGLGTDLSEGLRVVEKAFELSPAPIFAVGLSSDSQHILQALRCGAREHLDEGEVRDELLSALKKLKTAGVVAPRWGRLLAVTAAQAGLGVTTTASNLAFALAGHYPGRVVLAELGDVVPQLSLNLDLNPAHGLDSLAYAWERMDASLLRRALVNHPSNLAVLAYPPDTVRPAPFHEQAMRNLLILLRSMFDFTVIDLGHVLDAPRRQALAMSDKVVVVLRLDVPSLRLSRQFVKHLEELGTGPERFHAVVNRFGQAQQFSWKKAQQAIGLTVAEWIPDDPARVNKAVNFGQPLVLVARGALITRRFASLAKQLNGIKKQPT